MKTITKKFIVLSGMLAVTLAVGIIVFGCYVDDISSEMPDVKTPISKAKMDEVTEKYNLSDVPLTRADESKYKDLKPIRTEEELDAVLAYISKNFTIGHLEDQNYQDEIDFSLPLFKTRSETPQYVVKISGSNQNGRADVYLDYDTPSVVGSAFYNNPGFMDAFIGYEHISGSAYGPYLITFTAYGEIILKIIWQGVEIKRVPVTILGEFSKYTGDGRLTKF